MALVIDATPIGTATNNSYVTLAEANTFFESQYHSSTWTDITSDDLRNRALVNATRQIDLNNFLGAIVNDTQSLEFPRTGLPLVKGRDVNNIIPIQIKEATYLLAENIAKVDMNQLGNQSDALAGVKVGSIEIDYQSNDFTSGISNDTLPPQVADLLSMFSTSLSNGSVVDVTR